MLRTLFIASLAVVINGLDVPFVPGPHSTGNFTHGSQVIHPGAGMGIATWFPTEAGEYPVVMFLTGAGGTVASNSYEPILRRVAEYGYIIVSLDQLSFPNPSAYLSTMVQAVDWVEANLGELFLNNSYTKVKFNFETTGFAFMAQSAGNHMTVTYLNHTCGNAKAIIMIDPVDGADPFGIIHEYIIHPPSQVNFKIPALMMDCGLDPVSKNALFPACAPAKLSNDRFYNAWNSPIWAVNATEYGHMDCTTASAALCATHGKDRDQYHTQLGGLAAAFLDAVFRKKLGYLDLLENAKAFPVASLAKNDMNSMGRSVYPYCTHD